VAESHSSRIQREGNLVMPNIGDIKEATKLVRATAIAITISGRLVRVAVKSGGYN